MAAMYRRSEHQHEYTKNIPDRFVMGWLAKTRAQPGSNDRDRKRTENALQESNAYLENLINFANAPIIVWDTNFRITRFNRAFEILTGRTAEDVTGSDISILFPADRTETSMELINDTLGGKRWETVEIPILHINGSIHIVLWNSATIFADDGTTPVAAIAQGHDITARKQIEQELKDKNTELERYTYSVSHDLKSPLITIQSYAGMIKQDIEKGNYLRAQSDLTRIEEAASKMMLLLHNLLELSRVGKLMNQPAPVDMNRLVHDCLAQLAGTLRQKQVEVVVQPDLPMVSGDQQRIAEVLQNLVENAVKHMGDQTAPRIEIGTRREGSETVFLVGDNGAGIDPCHHERIFGLFNKLDDKSTGTGIGLALAKRIVEVHGGRIWVESHGIGNGSCFCFTLPHKQQ